MVMGILDPWMVILLLQCVTQSAVFKWVHTQHLDFMYVQKLCKLKVYAVPVDSIHCQTIEIGTVELWSNKKCESFNGILGCSQPF